MGEVTPAEGIKYGFQIMAYLLVVFIVGTIVLFIGIAIMGAAMRTGADQDPSILLAFVGFLLAAAGGFTFYAGMIGSLYKVIVDGVSRANQA